MRERKGAGVRRTTVRSFHLQVNRSVAALMSKPFGAYIEALGEVLEEGKRWGNSDVKGVHTARRQPGARGVFT